MKKLGESEENSDNEFNNYFNNDKNNNYNSNMNYPNTFNPFIFPNFIKNNYIPKFQYPIMPNIHFNPFLPYFYNNQYDNNFESQNMQMSKFNVNKFPKNSNKFKVKTLIS